MIITIIRNKQYMTQDSREVLKLQGYSVTQTGSVFCITFKRHRSDEVFPTAQAAWDYCNIHSLRSFETFKYAE